MGIAINPVFHNVITPVRTKNIFSQRCIFKSGVDNFSFTGDSKISDKQFDEVGRLQSVIYKNPIAPHSALHALTEDSEILTALVRGGHSKKELLKLEQDLSKSEPMKNLKVVSLVGCGAFALVFETNEGNVLKITPLDHFSGREPEDFDLPISASGRLQLFSNNHYYIEEKVSQDDISQDEIRDVVDRITGTGFMVTDITEDDKDYYRDKNVLFRTEQFGRASDGKVYLIDPGCIKLLSVYDIMSFFH